ncbi:MAG TPA: DMT family transporter [Acidobacteriaceae bacterium]|nr:DMT family transporter [Acidobacteriaceae bacterium]
MNSKRATAFLLLSLLWGSSWLAVGTLAGQMPPFAAAAVRCGIAAAVLLAVACIKGWKAPRGRALRSLLLLSLTLVVLPTVLLVWSARRAPEETSTILYGALPLVVVLLSSVWNDKRGESAGALPQAALYASLTGLGGLMLALWDARSFPDLPSGAAILLAVILTAASSIFAKEELKEVSPWMSSLVLFGVSALVFGLMSGASEHDAVVSWNGRILGSLLYLGVFAGAAGFPLYFWLLKELEARQVAAIEWIGPFVALMEGAVLWRQGLSWTMLAGLGIALASLKVLLRSRLEDDAILGIRGTL